MTSLSTRTKIFREQADAEAALQDLNVQWWRMTGALGIHPETDD